MASILTLTMPKKVQPSSDFGKRLTQMRKQKGLTQIQLAELIGSTQRAISRYETIAEFPPAVVIVQIAKALKISMDELMGLKPLRATGAKDDPETKRLWTKFQQIRSLPEKDRRAVIRLVNSLVAATRD